MKTRMIMGFCLAVMSTMGTAWADNKAAAPASSAASAPDTAAYTLANMALYNSNHIGSLTKNDVVHYTFSRQGTLEMPFEDKASITITAQDEQGKKNVLVDFLTGANHIDVPLFEGFKQGNPLLIVFLEHDVKVMSDLTKGSTLYFRNRIRDGLSSADKSSVTHTTITVDDKKIDATLVTVKPFVGVDHIESFKQFEQKSYQFVISPQVPGGIYSIKTFAPGADGKDPLMTETLSYTSRTATQ